VLIPEGRHDERIGAIVDQDVVNVVESIGVQANQAPMAGGQGKWTRKLMHSIQARLKAIRLCPILKDSDMGEVTVIPMVMTGISVMFTSRPQPEESESLD
jgi:hypothetical protein